MKDLKHRAALQLVHLVEHTAHVAVADHEVPHHLEGLVGSELGWRDVEPIETSDGHSGLRDCGCVPLQSVG